MVVPCIKENDLHIIVLVMYVVFFACDWLVTLGLNIYLIFIFVVFV